MNGDVDEIVVAIGKRLRGYGLSKSQSAQMMDDLRTEVRLAIDSGGAARDLVGTDLERFAKDLAIAAGFEPVPSRFLGLAFATALPPVLIAFFIYVVVIGGGPNLGLPEMRTAVDRNPSNDGLPDALGEGWIIAGTYGLGALLGLLLTFSAAAGYLALRNDTCIRRTITNMFLALPAGGVLGVLGAVSVGAMTNYSDDAEVIAVECVVVAACVLAALWLARRLARGLPLDIAATGH